MNFSIPVEGDCNDWTDTNDHVRAVRDEHFPGTPLSSQMLVDTVTRMDGSDQTRYTVGLAETYPPLNKAPRLGVKMNFMCNMMDAFISNDYETAGRLVSKLFDVVPCADKKPTGYRSSVSRAETNIESCWFSDHDPRSVATDAGCEKFALLNPTKGSIVRFNKSYGPVKVYLAERDSDYVVELIHVLKQLHWADPVVCTWNELPDDYYYYAGFAAQEAVNKGYACCGFTINLAALVLTKTHIIEIDAKKGYAKYAKGSLDVETHPCDVEYRLSADELQFKYAESSTYRYSQGILHDYVQTHAKKHELRIIEARPVPIDLRVCTDEGPISVDDDYFYVGEKAVMTKTGEEVEGAWHDPDNNFLAESRLAVGKYYGLLYDLGDCRRVLPSDIGMESDEPYVVLRKHHHGKVLWDGVKWYVEKRCASGLTLIEAYNNETPSTIYTTKYQYVYEQPIEIAPLVSGKFGIPIEDATTFVNAVCEGYVSRGEPPPLKRMKKKRRRRKRKKKG